MPKNVELTSLDQEKIETGGGLAKATSRDREIIYKQFIDWIANQADASVGLETNQDITLIGDAEIEKFVWSFFFTMRVAPKVVFQLIVIFK